MMSGQVPPQADEEARLAAALERIARAGLQLRHRPSRTQGAEPADAGNAAAARIEALIADIRATLGTDT